MCTCLYLFGLMAETCARVCHIPQVVEDLPPSHSFVLNKFNTMTDHALIITKEFQPQDEALTVYGEMAWLVTF